MSATPYPWANLSPRSVDPMQEMHARRSSHWVGSLPASPRDRDQTLKHGSSNTVHHDVRGSVYKGTPRPAKLMGRPSPYRALRSVPLLPPPHMLCLLFVYRTSTQA